MLVSFLPFVDAGPVPLFTAVPLAIVLGVAALSVASALGILWGVRLVSPGRAGLLMMMEVVTGLASAAAFAGEPFGVVQVAGSMLIVAGRPRRGAAGTPHPASRPGGRMSAWVVFMCCNYG